MTVLALDIGGANVKAAASGGQACSVPFALWRRPERLAEQLQSLVRQFEADSGEVDRLLVTMTGELCDCFASKRQGVKVILDAVAQAAEGRPVAVWSTNGQFVAIDQARAKPMAVAAANWHVLASFAATLHPAEPAVLIDTGSTTTDVIRLADGKPQPIGLTDTERLASGELVYLGISRTPLVALGPRIEPGGRQIGLMAECFATTQDVAVLLGKMPEQPENCETADGRALTIAAAAGRITRMIGSDRELTSLDQARALAGEFWSIMCRRIGEAIRQVLAGRAGHRVLVSGSGEALADEAAAASGLGPVEPLSARIGTEASAAACAFALLNLQEPVAPCPPRPCAWSSAGAVCWTCRTCRPASQRCAVSWARGWCWWSAAGRRPTRSGRSIAAAISIQPPPTG
jgi:hypothetical protein